MAQETTSAKKTKPKKAPQRGLGVAQLEKIILEETQRNEFLAKNAVSSQNVNKSSSNVSVLGFQDPSFRPSTRPLVPKTESWHQNSIRLSSEGELVSRALFGQRHENWPKSWNSEHNHDMSRFESRMNFGFESNVPVLAPISPSLMELPSIQSFHPKTCALTENDKIIGKKSYPFSLEANDISTLTKSDQSASCTNEYTLHMEPQNKLIRDRVWYSKERNLKKLKSDNMKLNGDFLTLAPPSIVDSPPLDHSFQDRQQLSENRTGIADKESVNSGIFHRRSGLVGNSSRYFSNNLGTCQNTNYGNNGNSEKGEIVDLSLKL